VLARFACIWNVTLAVCDSVNAIWTWPVEVSAGVPKFWLAPLFGHSMACPPEAAASFTTTNGANRLWVDRLSSSTFSTAPPELLVLEELELLELDELLLEEELLETTMPGSVPSICCAKATTLARSVEFRLRLV
jgi:hypothetical protein